MENLSEEKIINKNDRINSSLKEEEKEEEKNDDNNLDESSKEKKMEILEEESKKGELETNFSETNELTDEERYLRENYIKKITIKDVIIRSIILGRKAYYSKLYNFLINLVYNFISFKEVEYKADAVNAITSKDLDKFINSVKFHTIATIIYKVILFFDDYIFKYLTRDFRKSKFFRCWDYGYKEMIILWRLLWGEHVCSSLSGVRV